MNKKKRLDNEGKIDFKALYVEICEALGLTPTSEIDEVLETIESLMSPTTENKIKEALRLGIISETEKPYYIGLSRKNNADVLDLLELRKQEYEKSEKLKLGKLFREHNEKITIYLGVDGWDDVRKLGYDLAKNIVDKLPARVSLLAMQQNQFSSASNEIKNLSWYRKNEPRTLEENPELFQRLLREEKQTKRQ